MTDIDLEASTRVIGGSTDDLWKFSVDDWEARKLFGDAYPQNI